MTDQDPPVCRPTLVAVSGDLDRSAPEVSPTGIEQLLPEGANDDAVKRKIAELEDEHRGLDQSIQNIEERMPYDRITIQRLKKKKLVLKDQIAVLRDHLVPDIIA